MGTHFGYHLACYVPLNVFRQGDQELIYTSNKDCVGLIVKDVPAIAAVMSQKLDLYEAIRWNPYDSIN